MNEAEKLYQRNLILDYLKKHKTISSAQAFEFFGISKISTRIGEMIKSGVPIIKKWEKGFNRFGRKVRYMTYSLGEEDENRQ